MDIKLILLKKDGSYKSCGLPREVTVIDKVIAAASDVALSA